MVFVPAPTSCQKALVKYLANYAEPEVGRLCTDSVKTGKYAHCIVIPCYNEQISAIYRVFQQVLDIESLLAIIVVNAPDNASPSSLKSTAELLNALLDSFANSSSISTQITLLEQPKTRIPDTLVVDRCVVGEPIPKKQGVGLARKIGADIACYLYHQGLIESSLVFNTDADVVLPKHYIEDGVQAHRSGAAALVYPFEHHVESCAGPVQVNADSAQSDALIQVSLFYDLSIRYYAAGLRWAGSPYGFTAIGSTIAFDLYKYAMVRGLPKRAGGEDFYLLNKMAKVGTVHCLQTSRIRIEGRVSDRVPFGTGPALAKLIERPCLVDLNYWYHPSIFLRLRLWLKLLKSSWQAGDNALCYQPGALFEQVLSELGLREGETEYDELWQFGLSVNFDQLLWQAKQQFRTQERFDKHLNDWFDAFKTLKFVHFFRANYYPSVSVLFVREHVAEIAPGLLPKFEQLLSHYE